MNKKIISLVFVSLILAIPAVTFGITFCEMADRAKTVLLDIGIFIVVIGWLIAGILYLTAAGNAGKIEIAKKALIAAVIGTVLVLLANTAFEIIDDAFNIGAGQALGCIPA